jgi:hypothetical protein
MGKYSVLISEAAALDRRRLSPIQGKKLLWWRVRLAEDPTAGDSVRKELIPRELKRRFAVENLWRAELPGGWRFLYTIVAKVDIRPQVRIVRILTHKEYDRLFGYQTS